jgi:hypothetical protein
MKRFAAHCILPAGQPPIRNGMIETDDNGLILNISSYADNIRELENMLFFSGLLCTVLPDVFNFDIFNDLLIFNPDIIPFDELTASGNDAFGCLKALNLQYGYNFEQMFKIFCGYTANNAGTLAPGTHSGIAHIRPFNCTAMSLTPNSIYKRLI